MQDDTALTDRKRQVHYLVEGVDRLLTAYCEQTDVRQVVRSLNGPQGQSVVSGARRGQSVTYRANNRHGVEDNMCRQSTKLLSLIHI